jgi:hypothetical protein
VSQHFFRRVSSGKTANMGTLTMKNKEKTIINKEAQRKTHKKQWKTNDNKKKNTEKCRKPHKTTATCEPKFIPASLPAKQLTWAR